MILRIIYEKVIKGTKMRMERKRIYSKDEAGKGKEINIHNKQHAISQKNITLTKKQM